MRKTRYLLLALIILFVFIMGCGNSGPVKVVLLSGSNEYISNISLSKYKTYLEKRYADVEVVLLQANGELNAKDEYSNLPGVEALEDADVALIFMRRTTIDGEQLEQIKKFVNSGKPIVAIRTASHGMQNWLEFDKLVLGGNYHGHYPGSPEERGIDENGNRYPVGQPKGPTQEVKAVEGAEEHPVLDGVENFRSRYSLYRTSPVADDVEVLMTGTIQGEQPEPVVWTRNHNGGRVVYIGLGGLQDWQSSTFKRLVSNALFWTAKRKMTTFDPPAPEQRPQPKGAFTIPVRKSTEVNAKRAKPKADYFKKELNIGETAIIICDMWDNHWCKGATKRCVALAQKMDPVVKLAREKGIQIIHAPSSTLFFYDDWPQRQRMILAPEATKPQEKVIEEPALPIDDSDGGCDTDDKSYSAWTRQSPFIEIAEYDGISDNGDEIYNFFKYQGIKNVIMMGVHTNMCVLGRSFAIRQMTKWGLNCYLVRDLTDAMYDPRDVPYVSHDRGTELVVRHIEKYWCPSLKSQDLVKALQ